MQVIRHKRAGGKKTRFGAATFETGHLAFFGGYQLCENCGARYKLLISREDLDQLGRMAGSPVKTPMRVRLAKWLLAGYNAQDAQNANI